MIKASAEAKQLWMIGALSSILSFVFSGLDVLYTLFAINKLAISASEWSQIRAFRYILTILIVLVLGNLCREMGAEKDRRDHRDAGDP